MWEKCKQNYYDYGIRVFWLDEAEPEYGTYDFEALPLPHWSQRSRWATSTHSIIPSTFYEGMVAAGSGESS